MIAVKAIVRLDISRKYARAVDRPREDHVQEATYDCTVSFPAGFMLLETRMLILGGQLVNLG